MIKIKFPFTKIFRLKTFSPDRRFITSGLLISVLFTFSFIAMSLPEKEVMGAEVLQEITVKEGDTLWGISNYYLKDPRRWPEILKHNPQLSSDPNIVLPGMRIKVPLLLIKEHLRAAYLVYILQDVRYRRKKEAEWKKAWQNMELYDEDGVRTLEKSQAHVKLPSGEILRLFENSLLIVKPEKHEDEAELLSGEVRASKTKIITAETVVKPQITPKTEAPDFKTRIKSDKTTLVEVYKGIIDVTSQGKTVTVNEGFGTEVKFRSPPSLPVRLPDMPQLDVDASKNAVPVGGGLPVSGGKSGKLEIALVTAPSSIGGGAFSSSATTPPDGGTRPSQEEQNKNPAKDKEQQTARILGSAVKKYRLQISTSSSFISIVREEVKDLKDRISLDFSSLELPDGLYFWRVAYIDQLGFEGKFSDPRSFILDTKPPVLSLVSPEEGAEYDTDFIYIEGKTEPDVMLTVNDVPCNVESDGKFLYALLAKEGIVKIKITATDPAGNQTEVTRTVMKVKKGEVKKRASSPLSVIEKKAASSITLPLAILTISVIIGVVLILVKP